MASPLRIDGMAGDGDIPRGHTGSFFLNGSSRVSLDEDDDAFPMLEPGKQLGDFRLVRVLGVGGMGQVWEAEQLSLSRRVAFKSIRPDRGGKRLTEYFEREARAGARLNHPGVVSVYATGVEEGVHYIAQELVPGGHTFRDFLDATIEDGDGPPPNYYPKVAEFFAAVARALQAAHAAGVVHRDIKPQNILVGEDDRPVITDFGLARIETEAHLSHTGDFAGTYLYMSPEQVLGKRDQINARSDIFSLGAVFYEALTLSLPFQSESTLELTNEILFQRPADPRRSGHGVPRDLAVICAKMLEKRPSDRYATAGEVADDLERFGRGEAILARPPGPWLLARSWVNRHRTAASVAVVALVAAALVWGLRGDEPALEAAPLRLRVRAEAELQPELAGLDFVEFVDDPLASADYRLARDEAGEYTLSTLEGLAAGRDVELAEASAASALDLLRNEYRWRSRVAIFEERGRLPVTARFRPARPDELASLTAKPGEPVELLGRSGSSTRVVGGHESDPAWQVGFLELVNDHPRPLYTYVVSIPEDRTVNSIYPVGSEPVALGPGEKASLMVGVVIPEDWPLERPMVDRYIAISTPEPVELASMRPEEPVLRGRHIAEEEVEDPRWSLLLDDLNRIMREGEGSEDWGMTVLDLLVEKP